MNCEAISGANYRMWAKLLVDLTTQQLNNQIVNTIFHITEIDSTNNYLKNLLHNQYIEDGAVVYTDFQTSGKGQRGNSWESERGKNLLFSILLHPYKIKASEQFIISQAVSLGVAQFLNKYTDGITIKWPNDIYWREKKICGILIENTLEGDTIKDSICGIGININQAEFCSNAPNPVSLRQITGEEYNLDFMLKEVVDSIMYYYAMLQRGKSMAISDQYKNTLFRRDGFYLYNDGNVDFCARIKNVKHNGILVLETEEGEERSFAFKEVKYML